MLSLKMALGKCERTSLAEKVMASHSFCRRWLRTLLILGSLLLVGLQAACVRPSIRAEEEKSVAQLLTPKAEMVLTLTAWPTPPPLITQPPTSTAMMQPVWTATPEPSSDLVPTPLPATATAPSATSPIEAAPLGSNPPAVQLLIPSLNLDVPVVRVSWDIVYEDGSWRSEWQTAENAAGHHRNSANPGEAGNVIVSGHHNTKGEVFRQVSEIGQPGAVFSVGDNVILVAQDGQRYTYTVVDWDRFQEEGTSDAERRSHARYLAPTENATLTLVTCWPYESNTHRVVVIAKLQP
jgi:LPXTG-site transpeptidase (sortase) family protein